MPYLRLLRATNAPGAFVRFALWAGCAIFAVAASVKTDEFGAFKLADLADGHCVVKFEAEDYEAFETSVLVHDDDVVLGDVAIR